MQRIGLIAKPRLHKAKDLISSTVDWLNQRGIEVFVDASTASLLPYPLAAHPIEDIPAQVELVMVFGGDGTLLKVARLPQIHQVPILGVNLGGLGFLTVVSPDMVCQTLEHVLEGRFWLDERQRICTQVYRNEHLIANFLNLNEITVTKEAISRIIALDTYIDCKYVNTFLADGLIISTPTGSTAYSMSAGGPIIHPATGALVITPICPHTLTNRPIVVPDHLPVQVILKSEHEAAFLTGDGQEGLTLQPYDELRISKSDATIKLVQPTENNYFEVLRTKLNWGIRQTSGTTPPHCTPKRS